MTVYLVDFENVRSEGLRGVENLSEDDKVVIFYSVNADAITFDVHMLLSRSRADIEIFRILRGGRNSLDFQLSTYLGYLVMENRYRSIVIISQDKGFLCATSFWEANQEICNADIRMSKSIWADVNNEYQDSDFNNEFEGKFIEKVAIIPKKSGNTSYLNENNHVMKKDRQPQKPFSTVVEIRKPMQKTAKLQQEKKVRPEQKVQVEQKSQPEQKVRQIQKLQTEQKIQSKAQTQNPTSKNKIFAAEVKLNITEDIREIIEGKYDEKLVPLVVEVLGKSTGKQHFYRMLVSRLGQKQGHEIYMMIKGKYANLKRK